MTSALIGHAGFIGSNLKQQRAFDEYFDPTDIEHIAGRRFDLVVCSGPRTAKWQANADPAADRDNIECVVTALERANIGKLVVVSTVEVFLNPVDVDEDSPVPTAGLHAFGRNRRWLEQIAASRFDALVVRLPALYGPGLERNVLFDLLKDNDVSKIDSRGLYQFYDIGRLSRDIDLALDAELSLAHLTPEPDVVADVARAALGIEFTNEIASVPVRHDVHTRYARLFGGSGLYVEPKTRELYGIARFAQSSPRVPERNEINAYPTDPLDPQDR
jgi:nucleoside-diphosphate-sugar epimerase